MTLLAFSMPLPTPNAMMAKEATRPTISHTPLPMPQMPLMNIMLRAAPRVTGSGAASPKAPPMVYSSRNCWNMVPTEGRKAVKIEVMPSGVQKDTNRVQAKTVRNRLTPLKLR